MQGSIAAFMVANRNAHNREGTLFLDPGFPVQKQQCIVLGHSYRTFDVYNYRGEKLEKKMIKINLLAPLKLLQLPQVLSILT